MAKMSKEHDKEIRKKISKKLKNAVNPQKKEHKHKPFEEKGNLQKLYLYTVVVEQNVADTVIDIMQNLGSSAQFIHNGRGTAPSEVLGIINAVSDRKSIINAFISEDKLPALHEEITTFLKMGRRNRGVGFAVPLSSIQGIRMYKYLTQTF